MGLATPKDGWTLSDDLWAQFGPLIPKVTAAVSIGQRNAFGKTLF
jgi:hypothetical protein